MPYKPDY
ncbi:uncharacterized protein FFM5_15365 [Fusarium fujikuroi]|nr:uncharacterized protein FFM5_15365 [Fusarium fujikuroi]